MDVATYSAGIVFVWSAIDSQLAICLITFYCDPYSLFKFKFLFVSSLLYTHKDLIPCIPKLILNLTDTSSTS